MKVCLILENTNTNHGCQDYAVKNITNILKEINADYLIIHKKSKIYINKKNFENSVKKCDLIYFFGNESYFYYKISLLSKKLKKKMIIFPTCFDQKWSSPKSIIEQLIFLNFYQKKMLLKADLIHCTSIKQEQQLKKIDNNFKTITLPFHVDRISKSKNINSSNSMKCLFFFSYNRMKVFDQLIKIWCDINNSKWRLDVISFKDQKYINKFYDFTKYRYINFVESISLKNNQSKILKKYDFVIDLSNYNDFDSSILESLSQGVPVLTTNQTSWKIIQKKNAGWIINDSLIELKLVLNQIFCLSNKKLNIKKKNAIEVAKKFSKKKVSKLYFKVFQKILKL